MKILLDENFPLGLLRRLQADGLVTEHIITLGWRGVPDAKIRECLQDRELLFLTQDGDFLFSPSVPAVVVVSRVRQARPLADRIEVWRAAVRALLQAPPETERLFELTDGGVLLPWRDARLPGSV